MTDLPRPPRPCSPATGSRPPRCSGRSRSRRGGGGGGGAPGGRVRAVALNSGGANACTGPLGFQDTHATAERLAQSLTAQALAVADRTEGGAAGEIAVCSTGLIGARLRSG